MITQAQRDWLAVEVMGLQKEELYWRDPESEINGVIFMTEKNEGFLIRPVWQPDSDIEQAFMLLDKCGDYTISKTEGISNGEIYNGVTINDDLAEFAETMPLAICKAVLKASGYKETKQ